MATYAAHILQFSTTLIPVSCGYRFTRGPKSLCSSIERFVHGETPRFGGPPPQPGFVDPYLLRMAKPLTPRHLRFVQSALSGLLPPLRPSPLPTPPREGRRLVHGQGRLHQQDLPREMLSIDASRRPSMTRHSSLETPSDLSLDGFTTIRFRGRRSPARRRLSACAAQHDPRTNPQSPIPAFDFSNSGQRAPEGTRRPSTMPSEEHRFFTSAPSPARRLPGHPRRPAEFRGPGMSLVPSTAPRPCFAACPAKGTPRLRIGCLPPPTSGYGQTRFRA